MPFQSSSSLKAARALKNMLATISANQKGPVEVSQSTGRSAAGGRELQDRLAGPQVAELLGGDLPDVGGIGAQPLDGARQLVGAGAQGDDVALHGGDLAAHGAHAEHLVAAVDGEAGGQQHEAGAAEDARTHRAARV